MPIIKRLVVLGAVLLFGCSSQQMNPAETPKFFVSTVDMNYFNMMLRFSPVRDELSKELGYSVRLVSDWSLQSILVHLEDEKDYYQLLYVSPVEYSQINAITPLTPIAIRLNISNMATEVGLIVVHKSSPIKSVDDLKGKTFAFGPYESPYLFYNVLEYFKAKNFPTALLKNVSYNSDSLAAAKKVAFKWSDAGVVTETWWENTNDPALDLRRLMKDELRIIGRTAMMPEMIWAVTPSVDKKQQWKIKTVLTETISDMPSVLDGFKAKKFVAADDKNPGPIAERIKKIKNLPPPPSLLPIP